ncbi:MAG TPA: hypothetical protein VGV92_01660 [Gammaproteobacteria bacterium]|nr:hypothetical protein [Gammaproteobacteria bacterium]
MKLTYLIIGFALFLISSTTLADSNNCSAILTQTSNSWANQKTSTPDIEDALAQYGNCVDQDTQQLHTQMLKTNNYPLMGANGDFQDFTAALDNFTAIALKLSAAGGTSYDSIHYAYAELYKKQFKLLFYADYINKTSDPLITRLRSQQQPNLKYLKNYFEKTLLTYSPQQREILQHAFTRMISQSSFGEMHQKYIYLYAIFVIEPPSGKAFADPF